MLNIEWLAAYWSAHEIHTNLIIFLNLLGAMLLGLMVGYERSYHGRAAGMRTYGLVCMASAALTVIGGYPASWFGGHIMTVVGATDPTRIIQGIVTGIGFLGAGVIMKEGFNISGLTTAASLWAASVIGVMVGIGFYAAAILLAMLCAASMIWISKVEAWLPSRHAVAVTVRFRHGFEPSFDAVKQFTLAHGYQVAGGSMAITYEDNMPRWHFVVIALNKTSGRHLTEIAHQMTSLEGVDSFQLSHARN
jgi:putative Mg2+ transporter-C (MgtC) family protein